MVGCTFRTAHGRHQQYLDRNINGHAGPCFLSDRCGSGQGGSSAIDPELLAALWRERHPSGPPVAHTFRTRYADRWVRFHSLPDSKRYPESEDEYAIVLDRYNTILDELFADTDVFVVTMDWSNTPTGPAGYPTPRQMLHPDGIRWWTEREGSRGLVLRQVRWEPEPSGPLL